MTRPLIIALALLALRQAPADDPLREWADYACGPGGIELREWMRCVTHARLRASNANARRLPAFPAIAESWAFSSLSKRARG